MRFTALVLAAVLVALPAGGAAGQSSDQQAPKTTTSASPLTNGGTQPYSVDRVKRELKQLPPTTITEKHDGLKLAYFIQVFGTAPEIQFFKGVDLKNGPVPFPTPPTHADMLEQMTPQQYRHNVADIPSLLVWLGQQLKKKK
jgi:hypothetical protein